MTLPADDRRIQLVGALVALGIFAIDLITPLGVASGVPYVAVVLIAAKMQSPKRVLGTALACSGLTILGLAWSAEGGTVWIVVYNRAVAIFAIWVSAIVLYLRGIDARALMESRRALATLLGNLSGMAYRRSHDEAGTLLFASNGGVELCGYDRKTLRGGLGWYNLIVEADRKRVCDAIATAIIERQPFEVTYRIQRSGGGERWVWERGCRVTRPDSEWPVLEGFATDVTKARVLQDELAQRGKAEAVGVLAAGFAHEIGNPLAAIAALAESEERKATVPRTKKRLGQIQQHIERISRIMRRLMDFAHPPTHELEAIQLNDTLKQVVELVRFDTRCRKVAVAMDFNPHLPPVEGKADELVQVFTNLLLNALDAVQESADARPPRISVSTRTVVTKLGATARVVVEDNGPGFDDAVGRRLFEPFFTTKEVGRGTGLGLATSMRIVKEHGGHLTAQGRPGRGASFLIDLPAHRVATVEALVTDLKREVGAGPPGGRT